MSNEAKRILVVDDSPTVRRLIELILSQQGYKIYTAEDGDKGLEVAREISPSAILVDFVMPRMNGHMFCKTLRSDPKMKDIPIILISSKGEVVGQAFEESFGVLHYFTKPFEPDDLIAKLEQVLAGEPESPAEEAPPASKPAEDKAPAAKVAAIAPQAAPPAPATKPAKGGAEAPAGATGQSFAVEVQDALDKLLRQYFQKDFPLLMKNVMADTLRETGLVKSETLVLSGDLSHLALPDVLNFIHNSRLSGRLSIFSRDVFGEIFLENGLFVFSTVSRKGTHKFLTDLMCRDGRIKCSKKALQSVIDEARSKNLPVGRVLVERGHITNDELMEYLKRHAQEAFNAILEVTSGNFFLEKDALPVNLQDITFRLPLMNVLMEGLRLLDEKQLAQTEFRDESVVLVRLITNEDALESINLTEKELTFFSIIDGKKTLRQLIEQSGLTPLETKRICYTLTKVGLLQRKYA
ncbi:MAG: response regulator [Desulfuromonadales bacterium]|nr:response regulator [Desulfuromonadales bacterium]MDW7757536.1 response regulator [Desulfuromonadales bacterium]